MKGVEPRSIIAGIVQFDVHLGLVDANVERAKKGIHRLADQGTQLVLLPEMWSTGFANRRLHELAQTSPQVLAELISLAKTRQIVIIGSIPEKKGKEIYNTAYVVDSDGTVQEPYRKIHLFSPTGENNLFSRGDKAIVSNTTLGPIGLMICYDLRFPELCRALCLKGAGMVAVLAQWPASRIAHWRTLLRARAIENQLFVLGANRCGRDEDLEYGGHSSIISPWGEGLRKAGKRAANFTATMDYHLIETTRNQIPCLNERVPEAYV